MLKSYPSLDLFCLFPAANTFRDVCFPIQQYLDVNPTEGPASQAVDI